jgi:hypothetical protein
MLSNPTGSDWREDLELAHLTDAILDEDSKGYVGGDAWGLTDLNSGTVREKVSDADFGFTFRPGADDLGTYQRRIDAVEADVTYDVDGLAQDNDAVASGESIQSVIKFKFPASTRTLTTDTNFICQALVYNDGNHTAGTPTARLTLYEGTTQLAQKDQPVTVGVGAASPGSYDGVLLTLTATDISLADSNGNDIVLEVEMNGFANTNPNLYDLVNLKAVQIIYETPVWKAATQDQTSWGTPAPPDTDWTDASTPGGAF